MCWGGWGVGRALCRNRAVESEPCALCIQSQKGSGGRREKAAESAVEVSGGLVAQVSVPARPALFSLSLLFLFSGFNQCLPSPTHHITNFKRYN